ncbi:MAG: hypothetical protein A2201_04785 [Alicyclobacillus sp. RIFOXYA1_FULL_53_8]|nr:MAG: hypothetical protein A2201_04785 [Alicyclobacillus sp. RIFOXYA1_FULL_53_8]
MAVYALADLHLSSSVEKPMDIFGVAWEHHAEKIKTSWTNQVTVNDLVLIPGDISWAMTLLEAQADLDWIAQLPGVKVMIRGNHDYWWNGIQKIRRSLHPSLHALQNDAFVYDNVVVCGTRGWVSPSHPKFTLEDEAIYKREGERLKLTLEKAASHNLPIVAMLHYPPSGALGETTLFTQLLEEYGVRCCVYGHLHGPSHRFAVEGQSGGVEYRLVSADYINFSPLRIDDSCAF